VEGVAVGVKPWLTFSRKLKLINIYFYVIIYFFLYSLLSLCLNLKDYLDKIGC